MKEIIKVCAKLPGRQFKMIEIDNTLEAMQKLVGGYIEVVPLSTRAVLIVNEEGKIRQLEPNFEFFGVDVICGTAFICGVDGENFTDCPHTLPAIRGMFPECYGMEA